MMKLIFIIMGFFLTSNALADIVLEGDRVNRRAPYYYTNSGCGLTVDKGKVFGVSYFQQTTWHNEICEPHHSHCSGHSTPRTDYINEYYELDNVFEVIKVKKKKWNIYVRNSIGEKIKIGKIKKSFFGGKKSKLNKKIVSLSCGSSYFSMRIFD